jgi:hypothetical protein
MEPGSGSQLPPHPHDQEAGKFIIDVADVLPEQGKPLPEVYGDNRIVILPRDPLWFFSYWEVTLDRINALRDQVGAEMWQKGQATLRVYDVTGLEGDHVDANRCFDIAITLDARRWYIQVPESGHSYVVDLGFKFPDGRFYSLVRSNRIVLPMGRISDKTDSKWMIVNVSEWEKLMEVTPDHIGRGSAEISKIMAQRWEFLRSVFSGSSSQLSSRTSSWGSPVGTVEEKKP